MFIMSMPLFTKCNFIMSMPLFTKYNFIMSMPLFTKYNFVNVSFLDLILVVFDVGILESIKSNVVSYHCWLGNESALLLRKS